MFELIVAGIVLALCAAMLLRMALPERLRRRLDSRLRGTRLRAVDLGRRLRFGRRHRRLADREAAEVIERARRKAAREGNVHKLDATKRPRKPH